MVALNPRRNFETMAAQEVALGKQEAGARTSAWFIRHIKFGMWLKRWCSPPKWGSFIVNKEWIAAHKNKAVRADTPREKAAVPFVSSNDLITYWFFSDTGAR